MNLYENIDKTLELRYNMDIRRDNTPRKINTGRRASYARTCNFGGCRNRYRLYWQGHGFG